MAYNFSQHSDEELLAEYQRAKQGQAQPQQPQQPQGPQTIADLIGKVSPILKNTLVGGMQGATMGNEKGHRPLDDQYKMAQIQALTAKANAGPASYFTLDDEGNAVPVQGVGGMKPMPVGYSANYQRAAEKRGDVSEATVPLREAQTGLAGAQTEAAETGNRLMEQYLPSSEGQPGQPGSMGDIPPGTTMKAGPMNIQLNPALNDAQSGAVSSVQSLEPIISRIEQSIKGGIYNSKGGDVGRTLRQVRSGTKSGLLTYDDPALQSLQSDMNTLKKTIPFTEGGKALTPFEAKQVFALLTSTGKNDDQIINDLNQAMAILRSKDKIALGGRNAAMQGQTQQPVQQSQDDDYSTMSDEELRQIAGVSAVRG